MYARFSWLSLFLTFLMAVGFAAGCEPSGVPGELSEGYFEYHCIDESTDLYCQDSYTTEEFPSDIAVGSRFLITFEEDGRRRKVEPGSFHQVDFAGALSGMIIKQDGPHAFLALDNRGTVLDLIHVNAAHISSILLTNGSAPQSINDVVTKVTFDVGQTASLAGFVADDRENLLAGSIDYEWQSSDESVFTVSQNTGVCRLQLEAVGSGTAHLQVTVGELSVSLEVEVP